jgi:cytochrome c biogenesis protein CcdA
MLDLLPSLVPLLLVDLLNPVLFALMLVAIGTSRPFANSIALLAGHTASYFVSGILIAVGIDRIIDRLNNPLTVDFVLELLVGLACLWMALKSRDGGASKQEEPAGQLTPVYCFGYGAVVNFIGVPFAVPYFAAVNQLLKADLSTESSVLVLAIYNAAYALPFLLVPIAVALIGERSKPVLERINELLVKVVDKLMPLLLLLVGIALTADALSYLTTGETLW